MKLWQKSQSKKTVQSVESFTVGKDRKFDLFLAKFDLLGNVAHSIMLEKVGLLEKHELSMLVERCKYIYNDIILQNKFKIEEGVEDVHSQIELELTRFLGDVGKKIHSGRSRNDQVLLDTKLYLRNEIRKIIELSENLAHVFLKQSDTHKNDLLPGYTHLQIAMPSSFGLWFGAYGEALADDIHASLSLYEVINKNPLGSGAGYGSSFPLDRTLTTELLGFRAMDYNVVYAQMTRGKSEYNTAIILSLIANTLSRYAMDVCLYNSQNFAFIEIPEEYTTGSSIMPHKKNPDVAEILRGKLNILKTTPSQILSLLTNLPSGYHRELQLLKEVIIPAINELKECISMAAQMTEKMGVKKDLLKDQKYDLLFSVENVNAYVKEGIPFRDAYIKVGDEINNGSFKAHRKLEHTLEGSINNLDNDRIRNRMTDTIQQFEFEKIDHAYSNLLNYKV